MSKTKASPRNLLRIQEYPNSRKFKDSFIYIPEQTPDEANENGIVIPPGYYSRNQFVNLLRQCKHFPEAIQFLADMLEE